MIGDAICSNEIGCMLYSSEDKAAINCDSDNVYNNAAIKQVEAGSGGAHGNMLNYDRICVLFRKTQTVLLCELHSRKIREKPRKN